MGGGGASEGRGGSGGWARGGWRAGDGKEGGRGRGETEGVERGGGENRLSYAVRWVGKGAEAVLSEREGES